MLRGRALLILQSQTSARRYADRQFLREPRSWTQAFSCHASAQALPIPAADPAARCGEILLATPLRPGAPDHRQGAAAGRPRRGGLQAAGGAAPLLPGGRRSARRRGPRRARRAAHPENAIRRRPLGHGWWPADGGARRPGFRHCKRRRLAGLVQQGAPLGDAAKARVAPGGRVGSGARPRLPRRLRFADDALIRAPQRPLRRPPPRKSSSPWRPPRPPSASRRRRASARATRQRRAASRRRPSSWACPRVWTRRSTSPTRPSPRRRPPRPSCLRSFSTAARWSRLATSCGRRPRRSTSRASPIARAPSITPSTGRARRSSPARYALWTVPSFLSLLHLAAHTYPIPPPLQIPGRALPSRGGQIRGPMGEYRQAEALHAAQFTLRRRVGGQVLRAC